jgi:hypothetical protein
VHRRVRCDGVYFYLMLMPYLNNLTVCSGIRMTLHPSEIKDIERLQRYEQVFQKLLGNESFSKPDIWTCGESKGLIGRIMNLLIDEGSLVHQGKGVFRWEPDPMKAYEKEWLVSPRPSHQLKRLRKEERPREKLLRYGPLKLTTAELLAIFLRSGIQGKSAIIIANELLTQFRGVKGIFEADKTKLLVIKGLGVAKVGTGIGRRIFEGEDDICLQGEKLERDVRLPLSDDA